MKVDTKEVNPAFLSIMQNPSQKVFLDANFFIPPDRSEVAKVKAYSFTDFKECWLIPLLSEFAGLVIHESVYDELVADSVKHYADEQTSSNPPKLKIHYDSELNSMEESRAPGNAIIGNIIHQTLDLINNGKGEDDMSGELNSLNHMAYLSLTSKHKSWAHEKEVRALVPRFYGNYLELLPNKIFIGINCKEAHKDRLIKIAKKLQPHCEIFQMKNVGSSLNHWLVKEKINVDD